MPQATVKQLSVQKTSETFKTPKCLSMAQIRDQTLSTRKVCECKQIGPFSGEPDRIVQCSFLSEREETRRDLSKEATGHSQQNWYTKSYRAAWSQVCLGTERRTKDTETSLQMQSCSDRMGRV